MSTLSPIPYGAFGNNCFLVAKTDVDQDIEYTKTVVTKDETTVDDKVYNAFMTMYYTLYICDVESFYQSMDSLSKELSNHEASKVRDHVPIRVDHIKIVPGRI